MNLNSLSTINGCLLFRIFLFATIYTFLYPNNTYAQRIDFGYPNYLTKEEVLSLTNEALNGSPGAPASLSSFYSSCKKDLKEGNFWLEIAAENGNHLQQHNLSVVMMNGRWDERGSRRWRFWYDQSIKKITHVPAPVVNQSSRQLTENNLPEEGQSLKERYFLSEAEIPRLQDEALAGLPQTALRLHFYYEYVSLDRQESLYWARISAQNGDPVGQFEYGTLLSKDPDTRNQQRGTFWIDRATSAVVTEKKM